MVSGCDFPAEKKRITVSGRYRASQSVSLMHMWVIGDCEKRFGSVRVVLVMTIMMYVPVTCDK